MSVLSQDERRDTLDCAKGVLIFLIVVGHNHQLVNAFPEGRWFLYNWHVFSFFLISAFLPFRPHQPNFMTTRAVRYYVPFLMFFTLVWALSGGWGQPAEKVTAWFLAAIIGSADLLGEASGARLYWFLPALLGLTVIRWAIAKTGTLERIALPLVAIGGFLFAGMIPPPVEPYIPLGLPIALYALGPCLVFGALMTYVMAKDRSRILVWAIVSVLVLAICTVLAHSMGTTLVLAKFEYYDIRSLDALLTHAFIAVAACSSIVLLLAITIRPAVFVWLGKFSLLIYLGHQIFYLGMLRVLRAAVPGVVREHEILAGIALLVATLVVSSAFAYFTTRIVRLRRILTPRDLDDWRIGLGLKKNSEPLENPR